MKKRHVMLTALAVVVLAALPAFSAGTGKTLTADPKIKEVFVKVDLAKTGLLPSEITVHEGQTVTFELVATDAEHGFKISGYNVDKTVMPNKIEKVVINANKVGTFNITSPVKGDTALKGELLVLKK
jgi:heme/copper-type cytochrome/quinol oxidase subunit 2